MTRSLCTSCGLRNRNCQCHQALTTVNANANENGEITFNRTPLCSCIYYLITLVILGLIYIGLMSFAFNAPQSCSLEVFVDSFSVSNVSNVSNANATADWNIGLITKSKTCEVSLHKFKSGLFRGNKLISEVSIPDYFGLIVARKINEIPVSSTVFKAVETPRSGVVWDLRVEVMSSTKIHDGQGHRDGFLTVTCDGIPVNFTTDLTGDVKGSLIGYMRRCEFLFRQEFLDSSF